MRYVPVILTSTLDVGLQIYLGEGEVPRLIIMVLKPQVEARCLSYPVANLAFSDRDTRDNAFSHISAHYVSRGACGA